MNKKFDSPGQIRKRNIKRICVALALLLLAFAYFIPGPGQLAAISLLKDHKSAEISIVDIREVEEESRTRRGRKRINNVVYLDFQYSAEGQIFTQTKKFDEFDFMAFQDISMPEVWYHSDDAVNAKLAASVKADAEKTPMQRVFSVGIIALPALYILNIVLSFFFGREPKGYMPEGFYTDSSWLDVEDNYLIVLNAQKIDVVAFDKKAVSTIQERYQNHGSLDDIVQGVSVKQTSIPLDKITSVESEHFRDTIYIEYKEKDEEESKSLEFLSATVKAHALGKITAQLSPDLIRKDKQFSRFGAARWRIITMGVLAATTYYYADLVLVLVLGSIASLYFMKSSLARLMDPTHRSQWTLKEA